MEIKFIKAPESFRRLCLMASNSPAGRGLRLPPPYRRAGRPEVIKRILIVDDLPQILKTYLRVLNRLPVEVAAIDPQGPIRAQVLELAPGSDLIVMDGRMPSISGQALTKELREGGYRGYIVANSNDPDGQEQMMRAGADFKSPEKNPFDLRALFET